MASRNRSTTTRPIRVEPKRTSARINATKEGKSSAKTAKKLGTSPTQKSVSDEQKRDLDSAYRLLREIPDFPKPGILFRDITPLFATPWAFSLVIEELCRPFRGERIDAIIATEARGFIFGAPMAIALNIPLVPVRKPGKLPYRSHSASYDLEYGSAQLEIHQDALKAKSRVIIVDDVLATGGTALASAQLVKKLGAEVVAFAFVLELGFLGGRERLGDVLCHSIYRDS